MKHLILIGFLLIGTLSFAHTMDHTVMVPNDDAIHNVIDQDHATVSNVTPIERAESVNVNHAGINDRPLELATYGMRTVNGTGSGYVAPRYDEWLPKNEVPPNDEERT